MLDNDSAHLMLDQSAPASIRREDMEAVQALWDVRFLKHTSTRRGLGRPVVLMRRFLHAALFPLLAQLSEFHAALARMVSAVAAEQAEDEELGERVAVLERLLESAATQTSGHADSGHSLAVAALSATGGPVVVTADAGGGERLPAELRRARTDVEIAQGEPPWSLLERAESSLRGLAIGRSLERLEPRGALELLRAARTRLAPDGVIVVEGADPRSLAGLLDFWTDLARVRPYDPESVCRLLEDAGFTRLEVHADLPPEAGYTVLARAGTSTQ